MIEVESWLITTSGADFRPPRHNRDPAHHGVGSFRAQLQLLLRAL